MVSIDTLRVGRAAPHGKDGYRSGIAKYPVDVPTRLTRDGFVGDEQGDRRFHGGPEKAVHHYAAEHYGHWREALPRANCLEPGGFGENLSTHGMDEADIAIGDVFRIGTALVQVSQGRQPCWKLNDRFGIADMAERVQSTGRAGWYYRVLEEGIVATGSECHLIDRPTPEWTVRRVWQIFYLDPLDRASLEGITALPTLSDSWRGHARRRLETGKIEDWRQRLYGPSGAPARLATE
ncbi:MOSC domain-containing protein [Sphingomonas trueperi]|uniref:MOSC domain-containing protein n=1 Tax=Sphingomonas trueperi TaxID=53317 RepID=UPI000EAC3AAF